MVDQFPFGKAPFWLLCLALASSLLVLATRKEAAAERAELTLTTYTPPHIPAYKRVLPAFERKHGVKVSLQLVDSRALETRLQNSMLAGTEVPDLVEILDGGMGFFTRGPLSDVGFLDITERMQREGYRQRIVESRFSKWQSRGRLFAIPHDVHPVMLMYRADLVESLGIRPEQLQTWDDFAEVGLKVVKDLDGDGLPDRYMIDLPFSGNFGLTVLMLQRGVGLFGERGQITFNDPRTVETMIWYLRHTHGPRRIAVECGWGQSLMKAMTDGLALFYISPDWRTFQAQTDVPNLKGKLKVMPLPAWEKGGRRTSVWGGTGLAITRQTKHPELAWELAKFLYFTPEFLGQRFAEMNILPPFKDAWNLPEFHEPSAFFSGQALGAEFARLAPETPPSWDSPYQRTAEGKLNEAFSRVIEHYKAHRERGLREVIARELDEAERYLQNLMDRNVLARAK
jgi:arabinosaccharide transport system substrate-binding protein